VSARRPVAVLHAGAMKTGTTYLQSKLIANRTHLEQHGVKFAGRAWREQVHAVQALLGLSQHDPIVSTHSRGGWDRYVDEARDSDAPVSLLSMEFLSFADLPAARRAVTSLEDEAGREVHLVLTVRDTAAVVPALWQTTVTSGGLTTWPRFTAVVRASTKASGKVGAALAWARLPSARRFTEAIDIPRMIRVWTEVLPPEQVHLIVVPGPDAPRDRLWEIFSDLIGVDPAVAPEPPEHVNESLGYPSAELVRRVNDELTLRRPSDQRTVKVDLGRNGLSRLRRRERKAALDPATFRAAMRWNQHIRDVIEETGVRVHGDLADLPTDADPASYGVEEGQQPPTDAELLRAARAGYRAMWQRHQQATDQHLFPARTKRWRRRVRRQLVRPKNWPAQPDPVAAAVSDLAVLTKSVIGIERLLKKRRQQRREQQGSD
jgi:hypothetical protein